MAGRTDQVRRAARFAGSLYAGQVRGLVDTHLRRNEYARLRNAGADPYPVYERIRAAGTFVPTPGGQLATVDHAVCDAVLRSRRFGTEPEGAASVDPAFDRSFLTRNDPDHARLRALVAPVLSAQRVVDLRCLVETTVDGLLDDIGEAGEVDLVSRLAAPVPIAVVNAVLGVPEDDGRLLEGHAVTVADAAPGIRSLRQARNVMLAAASLTRIFERLLDERRGDPRDDLLSSLVAAERAGEIRSDELVPLCRMLLLAGFETSVNLIGSAVDRLLDHPEQWELLVADPALAGAVVQETLRFEPPVQRAGRVSFDDTEIAGHPIGAGQRVTLLIAGANRDPAVFRDPGRFDITRTDGAEHLAFSSGIHHCVGRPLAELEATITIARLAERVPGLRRAGAVRHRRSTLVRGPLVLPVATG
ncbi:cytochrome P450 [Nocardioides sp. MAH-18]|uniref:Cytochrome P450 n=1 Tax=Nocardioides agri TaxID=2682843 RepID=A0A6L6XXZ5_9ACTN|nr:MULTISPECIES: cytochrome P450 [unclassified Nocardioides]MBA2952411.1 cytochrome P450 [Nocardioides sp. CGMCC 1.13656]MVQ51573.1 cytochrome P450 [Nocardioides sp. MAH-18]